MKEGKKKDRKKETIEGREAKKKKKEEEHRETKGNTGE
jgi:hypothetical protein